MKDGIIVRLSGKLQKLNTWCATLAGLILFFVTITIFLDVILRYFFDRPSIWITEVSTYLFLYIIFLGTAYALQQGSHIRVTFLQSPLSSGVKRFVNLVTSLLSAIFTAVLLWQSWVMTWTAYSEHWTSPTMLNAPYAFIHVAMVVGSFLLLLTFLLTAMVQFKTVPNRSEEST